MTVALARLRCLQIPDLSPNATISKISSSSPFLPRTEPLRGTLVICSTSSSGYITFRFKVQWRRLSSDHLTFSNSRHQVFFSVARHLQLERCLSYTFIYLGSSDELRRISAYLWFELSLLASNDSNFQPCPPTVLNHPRTSKSFRLPGVCHCL